MRKWWWWLPGWREKWKLEKRRIKALSSITGERLSIELMAQRPRPNDDIPDDALLETVLKELREIQDKAERAAYKNDLNDLIGDAELQGLFAAYFCPASEIQIEGNLLIDQIEGWGIPKAAIKKLRDSLTEKLAASDPPDARSALYALFAERDSWEDYIDEYEKRMQRYTRRLFGAIIALSVLAVVALKFAFWFSPLLLFGLLLGGAAGSCVSVISKMPALDVSLAGELDAYARRILSRVGTGLVASLIGCASLAWIPVSIQNKTFAGAVNACTTDPCTTSTVACRGVELLTLLGLPMLLGFSERTLTSFEQQIFGSDAIRRKTK